MAGVRPKTTSRNVTLSRSSSSDRTNTRTKCNTPSSAGKSRNSTPSKNSRSASTPVHGQSPKAPEFSFNASAVSTVEATDVSGGSEKSGLNPPKLLKSLGPHQIPGRNDKTALKTSLGKTVAKPVPKKVAAPKEPQVDLRAMYMVYLQQVYLNKLLEQKKEQVLQEGEEQLLQLWGLVKDAKEEAEEMETREKLLKRYLQLADSCEKLKPVLTDISSTLEEIRPKYETLASDLDSVRHQIPLQNFCEVTPTQVGEVGRHLQNSKLVSEETLVPNMSEYETAMKLTGEMNRNVERGLALLEKCQELATSGTDSLGERLAFEIEASVKQLKLSDIEVSRRHVGQFGEMIRLTTGREALHYNNYGNHCGFGGGADVPAVDAVDHCCRIHDACYDDVNTSACFKSWIGAFFLYYTWVYDGSNITCDAEQETCRKAACECDQAAALCFSLHPYNGSNKRPSILDWLV